jgi:hypothetical protein
MDSTHEIMSLDDYLAGAHTGRPESVAEWGACDEASDEILVTANSQPW